CYYDKTVCGDIGAVDGEDTETAKGLTTVEMTGENALNNMVFACEDGEENPWFTKANDTYGLYYPHLKGFDFKTEDGERVEWPAEAGTQMTADEIETVYWPPKIEKYNVAVTVAPTGGGTVSGDGIYENGSKATLTATPKDYYHFVNWTEDGNEVSTDATYTFTVTGDRNLVANFAIDTFTITFENDDGTPLQSGSVAYGETPIYEGDTPTKGSTPEYSYTFAGWSPEIAEVTGDATYTATYIQTPVDYKLTWVIDDENYKNETIPFGSNVSAPEVDEKEGYTFEWVDEIPETMPAQDVTINGKYTAIKYTATFVYENGEPFETREYDVETTSIEEPAVPEKAGYEGKWEDYTLKIGGITVKPVYDNITSISIKNFEENSETGYKEDKTFTAEAKDLPEGTEIHWFVNGEDVGTGSSYKVEDPTEDYTVQAKVIDSDGNVLDETETQKVHVKNGFFDRIKAFFTELIAQILGKAIADLLFSVC
ncbi:MAG: InlB B-repeat-containing protein, partial [Clostridia bacterium]|nr:InlB B-repeat-containing protein [Clostridia bacterium]